MKIRDLKIKEILEICQDHPNCKECPFEEGDLDCMFDRNIMDWPLEDMRKEIEFRTNNTIEFPQEFFDSIKNAVYEGMKKFYEETGDDCKTYHQITKEAAERM